LHCVGEAQGNGSVLVLSNPIAEYPVDFVLLAMAPVVRIEPNGVQTLLLFDNAREDLERNGWRVFVEKFEGFNLAVAQQFALTFDGCRAKIGDVQLELNEDFISSATGLPAVGQKWFKNSKVDEVPWSLLFTSRKITSCDKGMPVTALKPRWHDLLAIVKQFVTCEGRYGLVFLYHLRLLMSFIDFPLNMPYFLLRSLYKMAKRFKRQKSDSSLFHHCLIKIIMVHQLKLNGDCWDAFLLRNGFASTEIGQVDKSVITETLVEPVIPPPCSCPLWNPRPIRTLPNPTLYLIRIPKVVVSLLKNLQRKSVKVIVISITRVKGPHVGFHDVPEINLSPVQTKQQLC
jgi:hypothetical protein